MNKMKGFTLVEIAIVLVIIGLLISGVLKGQELIDSAKVKSIANDFRNIPVYIYGYQDKFRALPGDDASASTHITGATNSSTPATCGGGSATCLGNGQLDGIWEPTAKTDETYLFWQHVRLSGLASGPTDSTTAIATFLPHNAEGGIIGIESGSARFIKDGGTATTYLPGSYVVCSKGIKGKLAKQLDIMLDDGNPQTGSLRVAAEEHKRGDAALATLDDSTLYLVCQGI